MNPHPLFSLIRQEIPGYAGAAMGDLDGGRCLHDGWPGVEAAALLRGLSTMARAHSDLYQELGGAVNFGSNDEVLLTASRGYLLLRLHHDRRRFLAVQLHASGNIGYLRYRMRDYLKTATEGA